MSTAYTKTAVERDVFASAGEHAQAMEKHLTSDDATGATLAVAR